MFSTTRVVALVDENTTLSGGDSEDGTESVTTSSTQFDVSIAKHDGRRLDYLAFRRTFGSRVNDASVDVVTHPGVGKGVELDIVEEQFTKTSSRVVISFGVFDEAGGVAVLVTHPKTFAERNVHILLVVLQVEDLHTHPLLLSIKPFFDFGEFVVLSPADDLVLTDVVILRRCPHKDRDKHPFTDELEVLADPAALLRYPGKTSGI